MNYSYFDLIEQSYYFPQDGFDLRNGYLTFYGISLKYLIDKYGTPFRLMYLPKIGEQIKKARNLFNRAIKNNSYEGRYNFCYCTKCNHFYHVVSEALKHKVDLETSSSYDIDLILSLFKKGNIDKNVKIIHNGYKTDDYIKKIIELNKEGFVNSITILDNKRELKKLTDFLKDGEKIKVGLRMAIDEESQSPYYTSRLGIKAKDIEDFYHENIRYNDKIEFKMLDHERLENDFVSFKLEDGTIVKVKVDLDRVGIAINFTNPDGTPHYAINTSVKLSIIPKNKKFSVEKKSVKGKQSSPPNQMFS